MPQLTNLGEFTADLVRETSGDDMGTRIAEALRRLNLLHPDEELLAYHERHGWKRKGSETFVAAAELTYRNGTVGTRPFVSKAILGADRIPLMLARQRVLAGEGIRTPALYAVHEGCLLQEFIPYSLDDVVQSGAFNEQLCDKLAYVAARLDARGFTTLGFTGDVMTDGQHIFYVDFGFDLGEPSPEKKRTSHGQLLRFLDMNKGLRHLKDFAVRRYAAHSECVPVGYRV